VRQTFPSLVLVGLMALVCPDARAVPSFSRQTGVKCDVCHSNPPELTAFGRKFKLEGYTLTDKKGDSTIEGEELQLNRYFPISVMFLLSESGTRTPAPGTQNWNAAFPQALSLFLAGEMSPHLGGLIQVTYSHSSDHVTLDNSDVRYVRNSTLGSKEFLYGLTLNNSPTVEDLWNSTPSWGYPWLSPSGVPTPTARPLIAGGLAQDVAGLGGYTMWNDHLYAAFTLYRSEHPGGPQPLTGTNFPINIQGVAPYWRIAWQQTWGVNYLELGAYGIHLSSIPSGVTGPRDTYTDSSIDLQYERPFGIDLLTVHTTYIHETSELNGTFATGAASQAAHSLNVFRADATYHLRRRYTLTLSGFSTTGSVDPILFAPGPVTGSLLGSPNSSGFIAQAGFWPKENIELSAAYTGYATFNGSSQNYDGSGRTASANNSVYVALWLNF
jgi:hypothetical protein